MRIKFIKPFRVIGNAPDDGSDSEVPVGRVVDLENDESTQWLIDNGFAEKVEESSLWLPNNGEKYYYLDGTGVVSLSDWKYTGFDAWRHGMGNVFKTYDAADRYRDYLEAVETVRHDEGFMKPSRKINYSPCGYGVYRGFGESIIAEVSDTTVSAGEFYFDTHEHAKASVEAHQPEWQTILNYDWSKGEEDEDEED